MKFHNKKVTIDGIDFDSQVEGRRYEELKAMKQSGIITDFELQPRFTVLKSYRKCPACHHVQEHIPKTTRKAVIYCHMCGQLTEVWPGVDYYADFKVIYPDGTIQIEDIKGSAEKKKMTKEFLIKWKFFELQNPGITLNIVVMPPVKRGKTSQISPTEQVKIWRGWRR
jgi:transcription elongation factor Elf1